jgi:hypothetical protein
MINELEKKGFVFDDKEYRASHMLGIFIYKNKN